MTFDISKDFPFSADHRLAGLPDGHKCARFHGHNYLVRVRLLAARTDRTGFVADYAALDPFGAWLAAEWDHRWLGAGTIGLVDDATGAVSQVTRPVFGGNPTAENLAACFRTWLCDETNIPGLWPDEVIRPLSVEVGVSETLKTWAWAR